jgi:NAD(P)-dependent dehydrogenase (short-subunit alcohol dehydrogenase family)
VAQGSEAVSTGRVAIVTGGSSGIGAAICRALARDGAIVVNADIAAPDDPALPAETFICDIIKDADVAAVVASVESRHGGVDILINNAGGAGSLLTIDAMTTPEWDRSIEFLLGGPRRMMTAAIPAMRRGGGGAIVNIASICGVVPGWGAVAYSVAKAALIHLTTVTAATLARDSIRVNAVSPGFIPTPLFGRLRGFDQTGRQRLAAAIRANAGGVQPIPRAGLPEDIAAAAAWLASPAASFVTGENLSVDGGLAATPAHMWDSASESPVLRAVRAGNAALRREDGLPDEA